MACWLRDDIFMEILKDTEYQKFYHTEVDDWWLGTQVTDLCTFYPQLVWAFEEENLHKSVQYMYLLWEGCNPLNTNGTKI